MFILKSSRPRVIPYPFVLAFTALCLAKSFSLPASQCLSKACSFSSSSTSPSRLTASHSKMFSPSLPAAPLAEISLQAVQDGAIVSGSSAFPAGELWKHTSAETDSAADPAAVVLYAVRRPGCVLCREDAFELSSRFSDGVYPPLHGTDAAAGKKGIKLVGVIKEVAPVSGAATDEVLGVGEFQRKYFGNHPLYLDAQHKFYAFFGNKSLLSQPLSTWNPFTLYKDFNSMKKRLDDKKIEGNLKGEGLLKGGLLVIVPGSTGGKIVYRHEESTGTCMPYDEIGHVLRDLYEEANGESS